MFPGIPVSAIKQEVRVDDPGHQESMRASKALRSPRFTLGRPMGKTGSSNFSLGCRFFPRRPASSSSFTTWDNCLLSLRAMALTASIQPSSKTNVVLFMHLCIHHFHLYVKLALPEAYGQDRTDTLCRGLAMIRCYVRSCRRARTDNRAANRCR
jgi:hypothetical protein